MRGKGKRLLTGAQQVVLGNSKRGFDVAISVAIVAAFKRCERIDTIHVLLALLGAFMAQRRS